MQVPETYLSSPDGRTPHIPLGGGAYEGGMDFWKLKFWKDRKTYVQIRPAAAGIFWWFGTVEKHKYLRRKTSQKRPQTSKISRPPSAAESNPTPTTKYPHMMKYDTNK